MRRQETALAKACLAGGVAAALGCGSATVQAQDLKKYDSNTKDFWLNPPADWFLGDENKEQKGQAPNPGQPTPTPGPSSRRSSPRSSCRPASRSRSGPRRSPGAADGVGRQGHAVRRHLRQGHRPCRQRPGRPEGREALHHRAAHADRRRVPGRRALRHRYRQALPLRQSRGQPRQGAAGQGRLRRLPALRAARLEVPGARRQGLVLHPRRRAL